MQEQRCPYQHPDRSGICDALLFKGDGVATIETSCWRCHRRVLVHLGDYTTSDAVMVELDKKALAV